MSLSLTGIVVSLRWNSPNNIRGDAVTSTWPGTVKIIMHILGKQFFLLMVQYLTLSLEQQCLDNQVFGSFQNIGLSRAVFCKSQKNGKVQVPCFIWFLVNFLITMLQEPIDTPTLSNHWLPDESLTIINIKITVHRNRWWVMVAGQSGDYR